VDGYLWTDYATGASRRLPQLDADAPSSLLPAGGDAFVYSVGNGTYKVGTPDRDSLIAYTLPEGGQLAGMGENATRALIVRVDPATNEAHAQVLSLAADGSYTAQPVTGLPDGMRPSVQNSARTDGVRHGILAYESLSSPRRYALVDLDTGAAATIPGTSGSLSMLLSPSGVAWKTVADGLATYHMLPQSAVMDGSAASMTAATTTFKAHSTTKDVLVGNHVLTGPLLSVYQPEPNSLFDYVFGSDTETTLLGTAFAAPVVSPDGSVLVSGGTDDTVSAVHRYTPEADGTLSDTTVLPLTPVESSNAGLSLAHGLLRHIDSTPMLEAPAQLTLRNYPLAPDSASPAGPTSTPLPAGTVPCATGVSCLRTVDGGRYGTSFLTTRSNGGASKIHSVSADGVDHAVTLPFNEDGGVVDASLDYTVVRSATKQWVVGTHDGERLLSGPVTAAALRDGTLWQAPADQPAGTVTATDLAAVPDPKTVRTITTGTACTPTELQAAQHWLYWSCGESGPAGVYDLTSGARIQVPAGPALLGDGYLVRHDTAAHQLVMTDFHTGSAAAPQVLADVPDSAVADDRGITFAVDRFEDGVAYVTADRKVHVLATGVPESALTATVTATEKAKPRFLPAGLPWRANVELDHPVDSWRLTVSDAAGHKTAAVFMGGAARQSVSVSWDGRMPDGGLAPSGPYTWQLTATRHGTGAEVPVADGTLTMWCGGMRYRSYDCAGDQALLAVRSAASGGASRWYQATPTGHLSDGGYSENWVQGTGPGQVTALVPFGDFNDDGMGDLLARDGKGVLTAYFGMGQANFDIDNPAITSLRIGSGWGVYNSMQSTGDITGDGLDDLVARDGSGVLWLYAGTGKSSFEPRVRIGSGWQVYTKITATGDLDGDGRGDMVARDTTGALWTYFGDGKGDFLPRVKTGTGWNAYNTLLGIGDLSHDGHPDLLARDPSGVLWRYDGTGDGHFGARVKVGTGWTPYTIF
jgi:hypothetical protein